LAPNPIPTQPFYGSDATPLKVTLPPNPALPAGTGAHQALMARMSSPEIAEGDKRVALVTPKSVRPRAQILPH
jgi:hypothetical protein